MGATCSKMPKVPTSPSTGNNNSSINGSSSASNSITSNDLSFYLAACQKDPDVKNFDATLHQHATAVVNAFNTDTNSRFDHHVGSLSFDSFALLTDSVMDINLKVVQFILDYKKDIWKNKELLSLVEDYFEYSVQTLDFFTALNQCLKRARDHHSMIQAALRRFEEEMKDNEQGDDVSEKYSETLKKLRSFKDAGDPFGQEFFTIFHLVQTQQEQFLMKLKDRKSRLDKKLKKVKVYRKVCNIIFGAVFVGVVICSIVAAAIASPDVASALADTVSAGGVGKWLDSLWKQYEGQLESENSVISALHRDTFITVIELKNIRVLVEKLEIVIESLLSNAEYALREADTLSMVMNEIKQKVKEFIKGIDKLTLHSDTYSKRIRQARTVILHRIEKYPGDPA